MNDRNCELVRVTTADGLVLDGALVVSRGAGTLPVDAFLLVHGTGSNFYAPGVLEIFARQAAGAGAAVLRVNTRGHDGISSIPGPGHAVRGGATFESIGDCVHDLRAWIDLLAARGCRRIVLVGHSMGGVKAMFAQARDPHPHVAAVLAISPPRFCHDRLANGPRGEQFRSEFVRMQELVALGRPDALVPVNFPLPFVATPAGYLEKYGPDDPYDYLPCLQKITSPVLVLIGSESAETSAAFAGAAEALAELRRASPHIAVEVVAGANINYANGQNVPFERGARWLGTLW